VVRVTVQAHRGRFITFEGGEGVGKSTQAQMLADVLRARGIGVLLTREPGGTPGAEAIRALLLDKLHDWDASAEALLFAAARADHVDHAIRPALEGRQWVVCDRFVDSSRAYQAGGGDLTDEEILALHAIGSRGLIPDLTILLDADGAQVAARLAARDGDGADRIGSRPADYHARVAQKFRALAAMDPDRFVLVDADGSPEAVHHRVMQAIFPLLTDWPGEGA
jgi:dTMP kinase